MTSSLSALLDRMFLQIFVLDSAFIYWVFYRHAASLCSDFIFYLYSQVSLATMLLKIYLLSIAFGVGQCQGRRIKLY